MNHWRSKVGALSAAALVMGTATALAAPAQAEPGDAPTTGHVIGWADGAVTVTYPGETGPQGLWAQLGDNGMGANGVGAIREDGTVDMLAAGQASALAVPANVSAQRTVSLSVGGPRSIWAASADGSVTKWGGSRGSFADQSWTAEQLGGKAIAVSGGVYRAYAIVETADGTHHVVVIAYGPDSVGGTEGVSTVTYGGEPVTGVVALSFMNRSAQGSYDTNVMALRADGSIVVLSDGQGLYEVRPAGADPVVAFGAQAGTPTNDVVTAATGSFVTQSGKSYGFRLVKENGLVLWNLQTWEDDNFPGIPEGETLKEVNSTGDTTAGSPQFLLTEQGNVVAWSSEPQAGGSGPAPDVPLPAAMAGGDVLDIADGAYALVAGDATPPLEATSTPTIAGTARVGETLTGTPAAFNDASATVANRWKANGTAIDGETGSTLALTAALQGQTITFESTATRGADTLTSESTPTAPVAAAVAPLAVTSVPTIAGTAQVGQKLTGTPAVFNDGSATVTNQWKANGAVISGATGTTLTLTAAQQAKTITFESTATRGGDTLTSASAARGPVTAAPIVKVYPKRPTLKITKKPTSKKAGKATVVVARASAATPVPTGTVRVTLTKGKTKRVVTATLSGGQRAVKLPKLAKGKWRIQVSYLGDGRYHPYASAVTVLKVK
ncbi:Ig-like domain repeat protein [Pimelobacter simplex]|uniref:Ig-like domain repeat protein n=1 Tax=Nocardioides simplex TaxID=2045 RepID=UPI003AAAF708